MDKSGSSNDGRGIGDGSVVGEEGLFSGECPDEGCGSQLYFVNGQQQVGCTRCGQLHASSALRSIEKVQGSARKMLFLLKHQLVAASLPPKSADLVKAHGMSNYHCKLLSPLLTYYGMDRQTGLAVPLAELPGQRLTFDCGAILSDRAFQIEPEYLDVPGYGRDQMGSLEYLQDTLELIDKFNDRSGCLVPIHADGDGHCLVHALSRALVGRELFWHALRHSLKTHLAANVSSYRELLCNFVEASEWQQIILECDPSYQPADDEQLGLSHVHVFGLANVLRRPIILLDSLSGLKNPAGYSCIFLPVLCRPEECRNKAGSLNKPVCIAWSSSARNHYIALVGVKGMPLPRLPRWMFSRPWAVSSIQIANYVAIEKDGACVVGGGNCLQHEYVEKLVAAMDRLFSEKYKVAPRLVCDVAEYICKPAGQSTLPVVVRELTCALLADRRLCRCLLCEALTALPASCILRHARHEQCALCVTDCNFCHSSVLRLVRPDGTTEYRNGDRTTTRATSIHCTCGFKHFWDGKEYDNMPLRFPIVIEWEGRTVNETVTWFYDESDKSLCSNAYNVACSLVDQHFPGRFGIERLYQRVVQMILQQTELHYQTLDAQRSTEAQLPSTSPHSAKCSQSEPMDTSHSRLPSKVDAGMSSDLPTAGSGSHAVPARTAIITDTVRGALPSTHDASLHDKSIAHAAVMEVPAEVISATNPRPPQSSTIACNRTVLVEVKRTGEKCQLKLDEDEVYATLVEKICISLKIDKNCIKSIKYGFPPQNLTNPDCGSSSHSTTQAQLPVKNGDKLTVELNAAPTSSSVSRGGMETTYDVENTAVDKLSDDEGAAAVQGASAFELQLRLLEMELYFASKVHGMTLWSYVETMPELFLRGGRIYELLRQGRRLRDGLHLTITLLGDKKILFYNGQNDRFELCLEPEGGHQPIGKLALGVSVAGREPASFAHPARLVRPATFAGRGHSLLQSTEGDCKEATVADRASTRSATYRKPTAMADDGSRRPDLNSVPIASDSLSMQGIFEPPTVATQDHETSSERLVTAGASASTALTVQPSFDTATGASATVRLGPGYTVLRPTKPDPAASGALLPTSEDIKRNGHKSIS